MKKLQAFRRRFEEAVNDVMNVPKALGIVWEMARSKPASREMYELILSCDEILALDLHLEPAPDAPVTETEKEGDPEILAMIEKRAAAKKEKNYAEADRIRAELAEQGIELIDTPKGTTYRRRA